MSETTFFEIILQVAEFTFDGRDEIEDPLDDALRQVGLGGVTGGGSGRGISNIDVEVIDPQRGLALIREILQDLGVAPSTIIRQAGVPSIEHPVWERSA
jgi:hypothetical protein